MHRHVKPRSMRRVIPLVVALVIAAVYSFQFGGLVQAAPGDLAFGKVTVDSNKNGAVDSGPTGSNDTPLAGVKVTLRGSDPNHQGWETVTAADGTWSFPASDDYSASPGPFTVTVDAKGVNGNNYLVPTAKTAGVNDFTRLSGETQVSLSDQIPASGAPVELNALVYPTWSTDVIALADPGGYQGKAIYTGTGPFDANDSQPGNDAGDGNNRVRTADVVNYNWSVVANAENDLDSDFTGWFEQTLTPGPGAVVNFGQWPATCNQATSTITAYPSGTTIQPRQDPPAGTTSVVLRCDMGAMGQSAGQKTLDTQVFVSGSSTNGATFDTSVRTYGATPDGVTTARPDGPKDFGPFEITAAPRYDLEKQRPWTYALSQKNVNGVQKLGWEIMYNIQISTDRKVGVETFQQPITFEDSLWAITNDGTATFQPSFPWQITSCAPNTGNSSVGPGATTVYGKIGGTNSANNGTTTATDSVRDSGKCAFERVGDPDTGNYKFTLSDIDASGATYPTKSVNGTLLPANKFYVASYAIKVFVPYEAVDAMDGIAGNGVGSVKLGNRVGDFDPKGASGASNYGDGNEPGYCVPGPNSDLATKCDKMPDGTRSNNVAPIEAELTISPGSWAKTLQNPTGTWGFRSKPLPESTNTNGDGAGQVQPGQTFASVVNAKISLDTQNLQMCDVWDGTMMKLDLLKNIPDNVSATDSVWNNAYAGVVEVSQGRGDPDRSKMPAFQNNATIKYAHVALPGDNANTGTFDNAHNRWEGNWTAQQAAGGSKIACGDPAVTWYDTPQEVPGGIDAVNAVWMQTKPGYTQLNSTVFSLMVGLQQRNTYYGGPHDGQEIPELTIAANFANLSSDTFGPWKSANDFVPGAGTTGGKTWADRKSSGMGDRWTLVRARMAITKHTIPGTVDGTDATGAAAVGVTGSAKAGTPVIWQIDPSLSASSDAPAPVNNVTVTDVLPKGAVYDPTATAALADNIAPSSYTENADGTTTLVWKLGTLTPNQPIGPFKVVTQADPLLPNNSQLINKTNITADGIAVAPAHSDDHTVVVTQPGSLQLKKSVDQVLDLQDQDQVFTVQVRNFAETLRVQPVTIIDVLPYNGDATNAAQVNRNPASDYAGTTKLDAAPKAFLFDGTTPAAGTFYYTTKDPATVPQHLDADTDPSIWSTTFTPDATAWKFVGSDTLTNVNTGAPSGLKITFKMNQDDNVAGDRYVNRFTAFSDTFVSNGKHQLLTSNQVMVRIVGFSLGDLIWFDLNNDGKFTPGVDRPAPQGVKVQVFAEDGTLVPGGNVTTNKDGRWVVNDLPTGKYYAVIPASEFAPGGPLEGYVAQTVGYQANPDTNDNENADHNGAAQADGSIKTGLITLSATVNGSVITGDEPLGDNTGNMPVTPGTTDGFTNFTLDMALKAPPGYEFTKVANPKSGSTVMAGDPITYTLTGTNTGKTPISALIEDDLTEVLKFAKVTTAPAAAIVGESGVPVPTLTGNDLSWTGTLKPGQSVTITYTVTVEKGHEGETINNHASSTGTPPYDPPITPPDVVTEHPIPGYEFTKVADPVSGTTVRPDGTITYTLTGTNTGATALDPVVIKDDLSKVLNNATMTTAPVATIAGQTGVPAVTVTGTDLAWTGKLAKGESVVITYTVTVNKGTDKGAVVIENLASSEATPPGKPPIEPPDVVTEHPVPGYEFTKSSDPVSKTIVYPGQEITYTLTGTNTGATQLDPVNINDDLSKVLNNATMVSAPAATIEGDDAPATAPAPTMTGTAMAWTGTLEKGQKVVITYKVKINLDADKNAVLIKNNASSTATPPGEPPIEPPGVVTEHPVPGYDFTKESDPKSGTTVYPGQEITYTLTGTNTGATQLDPVNIKDDLSKVLNNATMVSAPAATIEGVDAPATAPAPTMTGTAMAWTGTLEKGQKVVITYKVKINLDADKNAVLIKNNASSTATPPGEPPIEPPGVVTEHPVPGYTFTKVSDPVSSTPVVPGDTITYTLTGTNTGATILEPVNIKDDLSKVLNHAELTTEPVATINGQPAGAVVRNGTELTWQGTLQKGESVVITYTVTLDADAVGVIVNNHASSTATPPGEPPITPPDVETWHPTPGYTFNKTADPVSGTTVREGDVVTYTLTGTNSGKTVLDPVIVKDDLSKVLAFADLEDAPVATIVTADGSKPAEPKATLTGTALNWTGKLEQGEQVVITYSVKVKKGTEGKILKNVASSEATPPGKPPITPPEVTTEHPIPGYTVTKTADPKSGSEVPAGSKITYTVTGTNTGATVLDPVVISDDLSKVLNHAALTGKPKATIIGADGSSKAAAKPKVKGTTMTWTGKLAVGERVEITYVVTIDKSAAGVTVHNVVTSTAKPPHGPDITPPPSETEHHVPPVDDHVPPPTEPPGGPNLPDTGTMVSIGLVLLALLALLAGGVFVASGRRKSRN